MQAAAERGQRRRRHDIDYETVGMNASMLMVTVSGAAVVVPNDRNAWEVS
jgi:hypothetical protein